MAEEKEGWIYCYRVPLLLEIHPTDVARLNDEQLIAVKVGKTNPTNLFRRMYSSISGWKRVLATHNSENQTMVLCPNPHGEDFPFTQRPANNLSDLIQEIVSFGDSWEDVENLGFFFFLRL